MAHDVLYQHRRELDLCLFNEFESATRGQSRSAEADWQKATAYWMNSLRVIQSNAPISIVLNGGEYGLSDLGNAELAWMQDARVHAQMTNPYAVLTSAGYVVVNTNGTPWPQYISNQKARSLGPLTTAINQLLPNRELYIFYNTGNEQSRSFI